MLEKRKEISDCVRGEKRSFVFPCSIGTTGCPPLNQIKMFEGVMKCLIMLGVCQKCLIQNTILQNIQTATGAHTACYWMGKSGRIPGSKTASVFSWPLTQLHSPPQVQRLWMITAIPSLTRLHGVHGDKFTFPRHEQQMTASVSKYEAAACN